MDIDGSVVPHQERYKTMVTHHHMAASKYHNMTPQEQESQLRCLDMFMFSAPD